MLCLRNARAFPLLPAALASVPFGFVLVRVRVDSSSRETYSTSDFLQYSKPPEVSWLKNNSGVNERAIASSMEILSPGRPFKGYDFCCCVVQGYFVVFGENQVDKTS
jgi:hypothetical protein